MTLSEWRSTVRTAAHRAASAESKLHWGENDISFNYRWEHVEATVRLALRLATLTDADREIVEAAAWLHDIAKPDSREHGRDGALIACRLLGDTDFPQDKIQAVADAIEKHVGLFTEESLVPLEAAVLWDADKLSKLGATAVLHFVGYELMVGRGRTGEWLAELPDLPWMARTVQSFQTAPAQRLGRQRLEIYRSFWTQALLEFDGEDLRDDLSEMKHAGH